MTLRFWFVTYHAQHHVSRVPWHWWPLRYTTKECPVYIPPSFLIRLWCMSVNGYAGLALAPAVAPRRSPTLFDCLVPAGPSLPSGVATPCPVYAPGMRTRPRPRGLGIVISWPNNLKQVEHECLAGGGFSLLSARFYQRVVFITKVSPGRSLGTPTCPTFFVQDHAPGRLLQANCRLMSRVAKRATRRRQ